MPGFIDLDESIRPATLVTRDRCFMLYQFARHIASLPGEIAELGVYKGGTAKILAKACPTKRVHLFDTFEGMPATDEVKDIHKAGDFNDTSLEAVRSFLSDCPNVDFHPGYFPESIAGLEDLRFALAYIDADIYQSTKDALEFFYPRMVPGGIMVFDDYEWPRCPGVKLALEEFLAGKPERPVITAYIQCALFKM
jgi:hypothetical protein